MYFATKGRIGLVSALLSESVKYAADGGIERFTPEHLAAVYHRLHRPLLRSTPTVDFDAKPVDRQNVVPKEGNPFLASDAELRTMWREWAASHRDEQERTRMEALFAADKRRKRTKARRPVTAELPFGHTGQLD